MVLSVRRCSPIVTLLVRSGCYESVAHLADALDPADELLAGGEVARWVAGGPHPGRGAGEDDVAGLERDHGRQFGDQRRDREDEIGGAPFLDRFPVDAAAERQVVAILELVRGDQPRPRRTEAGKGLAEAELRGGTGHL